MRQVVDEISKRVGEAKTAISNLLKTSGSLPSLATSVTATSGIPFVDVITRADMIVHMSGELVTQPFEKFLIAPSNRLAGLRDQIATLAEAISRLWNSVTTINDWGGIERVDGGGVIISKSGNQTNLRPLLDEIVSFVDGAIEHYQAVATIVRPRSIGTFGAASRNLTDQTIKNDAILEQLEEQLASFRKRDSEIAARQEDIRSLEAESQRLAQEIEKARLTVQEYESRSAAATASIENARQQAASLEAEVKNYDDRFKGFSASLDERESRLALGNEALSQMQKTLEESQGKTVELNAKAEAMLGGATIAGLSSVYAKRASQVGSQLAWARAAYYISIALLLFSVAAALNLISLWGLISGLPPLPKFEPQAQAGSVALQILAGLGSRALVVLPSVLLAGFAAHRHAMLFRLGEEYSHKSAIAASVQGFKIQAPSFEEPMAAAVFRELLRNPAESMNAPKAASENGFLAKLIVPQVENALKKMEQFKSTAGGGN